MVLLRRFSIKESLPRENSHFHKSESTPDTVKHKTPKKPRNKSLILSSEALRRSNRLLGKVPPRVEELPEEETQNSIRTPIYTIQKPKRENVFGAVPDIPVGTIFSTRLEASHAGVHRPTVAGIHGNPSLGCYSLALSGGYEDDKDLGESFIYTGEGGRDLKGTKANPKNLRTAPQSKDQVLERGNLALVRNIEKKLPVRVLRGYKLKSEFAPEEGYRYDGLYRVIGYYSTTGLSGFNVYKFRMERIEDQEPPPWTMSEKKENSEVVVDCSSNKENISNDEN
ncbi:E3 ubiquitin-protein ligase UHRF1-like isoform X2 [Stegodyphus dumicola]|uniref:E3 ubiquitin-protein ligase UHRF1-like isoform X2 n=1 Tax=Stegodyphus dumicola TaxID=202533 RepID=UPI0015AAC956|nr:E3 ubiquitin-protein ligase UHRF1-like isoform X2 [Stegodyphus dumicola]